MGACKMKAHMTMVLMHCRRVSRHRQQGGVAALTGLALLVLVGILGLVLDLGHLYITKTELQNAADACALSGARELSVFNASTATRATDAAIAAGIANKVDLQASPVDIQTADVTFSASPDSGFSRDVTEETMYVRCEPHGANRLSIAMWFMQVFGIDQREMQAFATAKHIRSEGACAVPLTVCTDTPTPPDFGLTVGSWYKGRLEAGTAVSGNYGWIAFPGQASGTNALSDMIAGQGMCDLSDADVVYQNRGVSNGAAKAWNTRFGLYGSPYKTDTQNMNDHPPDETGKGYPGPAHSVWSLYDADRKTHAPYDPYDFMEKGKPVAYPGTPAPLTRQQHIDYGKKDRRIVAMPVIACSSWDPTEAASGEKKAMKRIGWACSLMVSPMEDAQGDIQLEYIGPCANAVDTEGFPKLVR